MLFSYTAKSKGGEIIQGVLDAADRLSIAHELRSRGLSPLSVTEENKSLIHKFSKFSSKFLSRVSVDEQIVFAKNLSGMLHAGLSLYRSLSVLKKQTKNSKLSFILGSLSDDINRGGTLSSGLSRFPDIFSKLFVSMTRAGEESGNLAGALSDIAINLEK